jgi:chemotaxis protein MotB
MSKGKERVVKDTAERWLLTYADLMNLLLIFFIILYAISNVDVAKYNQLAASLRSALGDSPASVHAISTDGAGINIIQMVAPEVVVPSTGEGNQMNEVKKQVDALIEKGKLQNDVYVSIQERGVLISITAQLLFKSGSAEIEPQSKQVVEKIGNTVLKAIPGKQIRIEGHTDNDPIYSREFPSNWELSAVRATNVLMLLVGDKVGINPKSISAVGYGEFRALVQNTSEENKKKNRRVDIVILRDAYFKAEAGTTTPSENKGTSIFAH